ncbi:MAG: FtsX-like permease family protein [Clostridiaceae bacterium]|nr:FtsX-like permease family protein [Clostridiaceae bacterium]
MRSIFLMAQKNVKKKKLQNTLIAIIIGVSALVLATGIGLLQGLEAPVDKMFKDTNASQDVISFEEGLYKVDEVKAWFFKQPNIEAITLFKGYNLSAKISIHGKKVDKSLRVVERPTLEQSQDKLIFVEGQKKNSPDSGEIWVPTSFAYENDLKLGELINLPTEAGNKPMKIAAIVVDPISSSSLMGTVRVWVGEGEIESIFSHKNNTFILGLRYKDLSRADNTWKDFETYLKAPFGGYRFEYENIRSCYEDLLKIAASVLMAFSILVIVCAVFVTAFTISNSILGDYKVIGILKSEGFTSKQIQFIYLLQFLLLSAISIPIGICLSYLCIKVIMTSTLKATGINSISSGSLASILITTLLIVVVIIATTFISSKKTCKIKPSDALKAVTEEHISSSGNHINLMNFKRFPLSFSLAIKQMATYKRQVIFIGLTLFLTSVVFSGTINSYNSIVKLGSNLAYWGFDNSELTAQFTTEGETSKDNIIREIKNQEKVINIVPWSWSSAAYKTEGGSSKIIELLAYEGDMNSIGIVNIKGRNPITIDEVSIAVNTSKNMKKETGDTVDLYFKGNRKSFIITGIYQSMMDGGTGVRLQKKPIEQYIDKTEEIMYAIKLKKGESSKNFADILSLKYNNKIDIKQTPEVFSGFISAITDNMAFALMFLIAVFTIITFIIIFNVTLITIYQQKKDLGIFKALGLLNSQIRRSIVYRILLSSLVGIALGIPAGIIILPKLLNQMLSGQGLVDFPFIVTGLGTLAVSILSVFIVVISVWIASIRVMNIKLTSLIND